MEIAMWQWVIVGIAAVVLIVGLIAKSKKGGDGGAPTAGPQQ
jgi:uncharacterized membrane protein